MGRSRHRPAEALGGTGLAEAPGGTGLAEALGGTGLAVGTVLLASASQAMVLTGNRFIAIRVFRAVSLSGRFVFGSFRSGLVVVLVAAAAMMVVAALASVLTGSARRVVHIGPEVGEQGDPRQ